jgi:hypothetical protein
MMSSTETSEITDVMQRVRSWPVSMRIILARRILETVEGAATLEPRSGQPRGYSAEEVRALLRIDQPAPDDAAVEQWLEEHRLEKYGR